MECEGPDDQPRLRVQGGMWKYSSKCQKKPRWMSSEISVLSPEDLSPWPPVSTYVFTCTSKDDRTAALQCSCAQSQLSQVCRTTRMWNASRSTTRGILSSVHLLQSSQAVRSVLNRPTSLPRLPQSSLEEASTDTETCRVSRDP